MIFLILKGAPLELGGKTEGSDDIWIDIQQGKEPQCPQPQKICGDWIKDPSKLTPTKQTPELLETIRTQEINPKYEEDEVQDEYILI